jgi:hypothetical protein
MQDKPDPGRLLAAVVRFLREDAGPALARSDESALAYQARVAANMLDIVARQLQFAASADAAELARLRDLLGPQVLLDDACEAGLAAELVRLNQGLADRIASGALDAASPGLTDHLWRSTLAKLAVDQPTYDAYRRALAADPDAARDANRSDQD